MNILFQCQFCKTSMQADENAVGKKCVCVSCGSQTTIQPNRDTINRPNMSDKARSARSARSKTILIACPRCSNELEYATALVGTKGLCRRCHEIFLLPKPGLKPIRLNREPDAIAFECPTCLQLFEGKKEQIGKKGKCSTCSSVFPILAIEPLALEALANKSSALEQENRPVPQPSADRQQTTLAGTTKKGGVLKAEIVDDNLPAHFGSLGPEPAAPVPGSFDLATGNLFSQSTFDKPAQSFAGVNPYFYDALDIPQSSGFSQLENTSQWTPVRSSASFGTLLEKTLNALFPAMFYMCLPILITIGSVFGTFFVVYLVAEHLFPMINLDLSTASLETRIIVRAVILIFTYAGLIGPPLYFMPSMYQMAVKAARQKTVSSEDLFMPIGLRLQILGFILIQSILMMPVLAIIYGPMAILVGMLGPKLPFAIFIILSLMASIASYMQMNLLAIGAAIVADKRPVGEAISSSLRIVTSNFGLFLLTCIIELVPLTLISMTVIGAIFFVPQFVMIQGAVFYRLHVSALKQNR